jgi:crotonobetainyl-CoA:carnitine CoA-transferase CaiB-like acyl-CoA transferase
MTDFFKDLKIVELANVLAGPAVGMFFSEQGAEVIKIENKLTYGDVTRTWKLPTEDKNNSFSSYYASVNYNKKKIFVDLTNEREKQQVYNLIEDADIVISNYKPGDDIKLGMDYSTLKHINPNVIYAHLTGFGEKIKRTGYDLILQAEAGFMYMNGTAESGPLKMPVALIDILAAHQMKEGILTALIKKLKTGKGSKITVSLFDAAIASLANQASGWLTAGVNPQPIGSLHPTIAPYGEIFVTKDRKQIVLAIGNNKQFLQLCQTLNILEIAADIKFKTNQDRVYNRNELFKILQSAIEKSDAFDLVSHFLQKDIPAGIIKSVKDIFDDPSSSHLILENKLSDIERSRCVKTVVYQISD